MKTAVGGLQIMSASIPSHTLQPKQICPEGFLNICIRVDILKINC